MAIVAGAVVPLDEKRRRRHDLLAQLREVDHWRRLVAARLDLAVAAVTAIDEPVDDGRDPATAGHLPPGLREILGLPVCEAALPEAAVLLRLRAALRDLDAYATTLRESTDLATLALACAMDSERVAQRIPRRPGYPRNEPRTGPRPEDGPHLHVVPDHAPQSPAPSPAGPAPGPATVHSTDRTP